MSIRYEETRFEGYDCIRLENQALKLWITESCGPRIIGLNLHGQDNLMALLPNATYKTPSGIDYHFRGGHRLWHGPEDPERTYVPDDKPVSVQQIDGGLLIKQPVEGLTGIQKVMEVTLSERESLVTLNHTLTNRGSQDVSLAPWAITQLKPGGFAILPQSVQPTGLLPNRRFALWPYTSINSSHLEWGDMYIFVRATMRSGKLKIGWANPVGWLAYWIDGTLFVKQAGYLPLSEYPDFGSSSECYCDPHFLELETLGPVTSLAPGQSVSHEERWLLISDINAEPEESSVAEIAGMIERRD
jgi:hypothetical protein